jgi:HAD superfamily hydrolase (TIGR01509 family)
VSALVFDCDGVLADTERYGHLPAFNQTFEEFGLPVRWSEEEYGRKLQIGGGKERMASLLTPEFVREAGLPTDPEGQRAQVAAGRLPARPGVARVIGEALAAGWPVAVASTSAEESVRAVVEHVVAPELAARIAVFAGDVVPAKKPDPAIYRLVVEDLGLDRGRTLVVEDSRNGLRAAAGAGLRCLVTVNAYTEHEDLTEAVLVVSALGDPDDAPIRVLANRGRARPGAYLTLADLEACLEP